MRRELLASKKKETGLSLDPRTKLALLVTIALFVLSGGGGAASKQFAPILAAVPLILLLTEKSWKGSVIYFVLYGGSYILQLWALPHLSGLPNFLVVAICGFFMHFRYGSGCIQSDRRHTYELFPLQEVRILLFYLSVC